MTTPQPFICYQPLMHPDDRLTRLAQVFDVNLCSVVYSGHDEDTEMRLSRIRRAYQKVAEGIQQICPEGAARSEALRYLWLTGTLLNLVAVGGYLYDGDERVKHHLWLAQDQFLLCRLNAEASIVFAANAY